MVWLFSTLTSSMNAFPLYIQSSDMLKGCYHLILPDSHFFHHKSSIFTRAVFPEVIASDYWDTPQLQIFHQCSGVSPNIPGNPPIFRQDSMEYQYYRKGENLILIPPCVSFVREYTTAQEDVMKFRIMCSKKIYAPYKKDLT